MRTSPDAPVRPAFGVLATALNFPMVFAGLAAIAILTGGDDEVALVNLWACWGIFQALFGQVGLVQGALDRLPWRHPRVLRDVLAAGTAVGAGGWLLRESLFPAHPQWWLALACIGAATLLIGRMRGVLSSANDGVATVVITTIENTLRSVVLIVLLLAADTSDGVGLAAPVIVAPFAVSLMLLDWRSRIPDDRSGSTDDVEHRAVGASGSVWTGVMASLPAVAAYAVVPGLTLLDRVADLDAYAIATSLLRGPLLVATFASAWLLQEVRNRPSELGWVAGAGLAFLVAAHVIIQLLFDPGLIVGLIVHGVLSGAALFVSYVTVLGSIDGLARHAATTATLVAAILVFVVALVASTRTDWLHPFISLTAMGVALTLAAMVEPMSGEAVA